MILFGKGIAVLLYVNITVYLLSKVASGRLVIHPIVTAFIPLFVFNVANNYNGEGLNDTSALPNSCTK